MSTLFLVPCSCGEKLQVEISQAGEVLVCSCGRSLEIPALRSLRQLDSVSGPTRPSDHRRWSPSQGVLFVAGSAIFVVSLAAATFLLVAKWEGTTSGFGASHSKATVREDLVDLSPDEAWHEWQVLREVRERPHLRLHHDRDRDHGLYLRVAVVFAVVGIAIAGSALVVRPG